MVFHSKISIHTRSVIFKGRNKFQSNQASEIQYMTNTFEHLKHHISSLHAKTTGSTDMIIDDDIFQNVSSVNRFLQYKLFDIIKRPLAKRVRVCCSECSSGFIYHTLENSIPCAFESFSHIALNSSGMVKQNNL